MSEANTPPPINQEIPDQEGKESISSESPLGISKNNFILDQKDTVIIDVWESNFEEELWKIMSLIPKYNMIAMDTEFPGVNRIPMGQIEEKDFEYQLIKENVRSQKIIQLGITLTDENGNLPPQSSTWQFNFKFDEDQDIIAEDSKALLKNAGIDFSRLKNEGLCSRHFAELFISSDILLNDEITWVVFHGGFDFGYFLQMVYGTIIPDTVEQFYQLLKVFFPLIHDLKYIIKDSPFKDYGLQKLSNELKVRKIGPQHQAGSDSLLTLKTYFKLKSKYQNSTEIQSFDKYQNIICGLGKGFMVGTYISKLQKQALEQNENQMYQNAASFGQFPQQNLFYVDQQYQQMNEYNPQLMHPQYQMNYQQQQQWMYMNYGTQLQEDVMQQQYQQNINKQQYGKKPF